MFILCFPAYRSAGFQTKINRVICKLMHARLSELKQISYAHSSVSIHANIIMLSLTPTARQSRRNKRTPLCTCCRFSLKTKQELMWASSVFAGQRDPSLAPKESPFKEWIQGCCLVETSPKLSLISSLPPVHVLLNGKSHLFTYD